VVERTSKINEQMNNLKLLFIVWLSSAGLIYPCMLKAQDNKISFPAGTIVVKEVIKQIEKQTPYTVAYNHTDLDINRKVELPNGLLTVEETLTFLLKDTGCTYLIEGNHILFQKQKAQQTSQTIIRQSISPEPAKNTKGKNEYTGKVSDAKTQSPLAYATIALLTADQEILTAGVTNDKGVFHLVTKEKAAHLRISFIGYKTREQPLSGLNNNPDLGVFALQEDETQLNEVTVTASGVQYHVDRNSYVITDDMRKKASNAQELLDQIHGIRVDKVTNTIKVGNETAVLLLVDGMQQSQEYIKNLAPDRIQRIEVVNEPTGRYLSEGYAAIINYVLKKDYTGYDFLVRNFTIPSPFGSNGDDWLMNEQPLLGFTYTRNKVSLYGHFAYGHSRWNTPVERYVSYGKSIAYESEKVTTDNPNDFYKYNGNYATIGLNYHLTDNHTLSVQAEQTYSNIRTEIQFWKKMANNPDEDFYDMNDRTLNRTKDHDWVGTVFYKGQINDRWNLYSDFSYNYYYNSIYNEYISTQRTESGWQSETSFSLREYEENRKLTSFNVEANYKLSSILTFNLGYSNIWRRYNSDSKAGENFLDYKETRNKFFFYLSLNPSERWKIKLGTAVENIDIKEKEAKRQEWSLQPYLQLNYEAGKNLNIHAAYVTNNYYPSLYQLSPMTTAIDTFLLQIGNPNLQSAIRHSASLRFTFWNRISLVPSFKYTPKRISEIYTRQGQDYFRSFANINAKQYGIQVLLDQPLGKYFTLNGMYMYYYGKVKYEQIRNSERGWLLDIDLNYFHPAHNLGVTLGYYRGLEKSMMLQGYQNINMDNWILSFSKQWWDNRLSLSVDYILPLSLGVRWDQKKEINTPDFQEKVSQSLRTYENMLLVRLGFRFNSGQVKQTGKKSTIEREQREQRTTPF